MCPARAFAYRAATHDRRKAVAAEFEEALEQPERAAWLDVVFVVAGFALLLVGARLLLAGATVVAAQFGISQVVIGLTIVAIGSNTLNILLVEQPPGPPAISHLW